ncbi:MAG: thiamine pyrophosphate-dependent enzyme [candidate division WOR-3 bacterium]|nr:thiamine pyrophosphate-dependent enzyme [candidate division WOR-3 bacterium]
MESNILERTHPIDDILCTDRLPSVWCPGCSIGTVVYSFAEALREAQIDHESITLITGAGCTACVGDYVNLRSQRSKDRYLLDSAADTKLVDPASRVVVFMNNVDLLMSGARDLARVTRRCVPMLVIYINNILYMLTKDGAVINCPYTRPSWDGKFELPFNVPGLAIEYGARYVARWTQLHAGWLKYSIFEAFSRTGLSLVEIVVPCLVYKTDTGLIGEVSERVRIYDTRTDLHTVDKMHELDVRNPKHIVIGKLFDGNDT